MIEKAVLLGVVAMAVLGIGSSLQAQVTGMFDKIEAAQCSAQNVCVTVERDAQ